MARPSRKVYATLTISGIEGRPDINVEILPPDISRRVLECVRAQPGRRAGELAETLDTIVYAVAGAISGLAQQGRIRKVLHRGVARWRPVRRRRVRS